jgi:hypothetical protein
MALTYDQLSELMVDPQFRGRIKVACLKYANYVLNLTSSAPIPMALSRWAQDTFASPDQAAQLVQPSVVMDPGVMESGASINDQTLQSAVENVIKKMQ